MTDDEKIRAILRLEADAVEPSPAGWDAIQQGISRSRPRVWWTRGAALAGAAAVFVGAAVYVAADRSQRAVDGVPATRGPVTSGTPTARPADSRPRPIGAVFPLTTTTEVRRWLADPEAMPALRTTKGAALAFARHYLGQPDAKIVGEDAYGESTVELRVGQASVGRIVVRGFGPDGTAPFSVVRAESNPVRILAPLPGAVVGRDLTASGVAEPLDGQQLRVDVRADRDGVLPGLVEASTSFDERPDGWHVDVSLADEPPLTGSLLALIETVEEDARSSLVAVAAIPLTFGETDPPDRLVVARAGRLAVVSATTGAVERWLTAAQPGAGAAEPEVSDDGKSVVYVQSVGTCASEIRRVPLAGGRPETLVGSDEGRLSHPSARGDVLAYVRTLCRAGGDEQEVVVRKGGSVAGTWRGDVVAGPAVGERFVAFVTTDGTAQTLRRVDPARTQDERTAAAVDGCRWLALTWGPRDLDGTDDLHTAVLCRGSGEEAAFVDTYDAELRERARGEPLDTPPPRSLDLHGGSFVVGTRANPYVVRGTTTTRVPGTGQRPGWLP